MEMLKIHETNFPVDQLIISRTKTERRIEFLTDYFEEFERTQFKGRYITNEYYQFQKELEKLKEYHKQITKQIDEKKQLKRK